MKKPATTAPPCLNCGKPLRPYKYRKGGPSPFDTARDWEQWGDYGDNCFCGHTCGYQWALAQVGLYTYQKQAKDFQFLLPPDSQSHLANKLRSRGRP